MKYSFFFKINILAFNILIPVSFPLVVVSHPNLIRYEVVPLYFFQISLMYSNLTLVMNFQFNKEEKVTCSKFW